MDTQTVAFINRDYAHTNLCDECSDDGVPDPNPEVTHCEKCGQRIEGRLSLWT